jgi:hypothetical protein
MLREYQASLSSMISPETQGGEKHMSNMNSTSSTSKVVVPGAKQYLNNMKYEIANELGVNLKQGYNGDLTSREAGYIGGYMVKRMIEQHERQMSGK